MTDNTNYTDFTNCERVAGRAYNGANGKKLAVLYKGEVWILKFAPNVADRPNSQSYSNGPLSEHIGCLIYRSLGIPVQDTELGIFTNNRTRTVCACRDFTCKGVRLYDFCSIKNTVIESEGEGTGTEIEEIMETIRMQDFADPAEVSRRFWDMFVTDALLGNFDRHNGNWGFLMDENTGKTRLAPVFDCGSCLLPQADDDIMRKCLADRKEMDARIFTFPLSMIKAGGSKINYYDYINNQSRPKGLDESLQRLTPLIDKLDFHSIIAGVPLLTPLQREFYTEYLTERRSIILHGESQCEKENIKTEQKKAAGQHRRRKGLSI